MLPDRLARESEVIESSAAAAMPIARVYGQPMMEVPRDLYIPPDALEIFLEQFEGPLDLLLYLIRKENISVLDVPMRRSAFRRHRSRCRRERATHRMRHPVRERVEPQRG